MSSTPSADWVAHRRVRHRARDSVAVMAVSAAMSGGLAVALTLLLGLGR